MRPKGKILVAGADATLVGQIEFVLRAHKYAVTFAFGQLGTSLALKSEQFDAIISVKPDTKTLFALRSGMVPVIALVDVNKGDPITYPAVVLSGSYMATLIETITEVTRKKRGPKRVDTVQAVAA